MHQSRLNENTMAFDVDQREMLNTYPEVVKRLLRTYAIDEVITGAVSDATSFLQRSNMAEQVCSYQI